MNKAKIKHLGGMLICALLANPCHAQEAANLPQLNKPVALSDSDYIAPAEEIAWAKSFRGVSGAGHPVIGDGRGGWISGSKGVRYDGEYMRPEYTPTEFPKSGLAMDKGLLPPIVPALDVHLRDGVVTVGGDGMYYLTGSSGDNIWAWAQGIELWRSADLREWDYLGLVWEIDTEAPAKADYPASGDYAQKPFRNRVRYFHVSLVCEITLHRVHHNVCAAAFSLVIRERKRKFRVHNRKFRPCDVVVV